MIRYNNFVCTLSVTTLSSTVIFFLNVYFIMLFIRLQCPTHYVITLSYYYFFKGDCNQKRHYFTIWLFLINALRDFLTAHIANLNTNFLWHTLWKSKHISHVMQPVLLPRSFTWHRARGSHATACRPVAPASRIMNNNSFSRRLRAPVPFEADLFFLYGYLGPKDKP